MNGRAPVLSILLTGAIFWLWMGLAIASTPTSITIAVNEDRINAKLNAAPLEQVLAALGQRLGFTAHLDPSLSNTVLTETLQDVPIDGVLDRLLRGMNYALAGSSLFVWPRVEGSATAPTNPAEWTVVAADKAVEDNSLEETSSIESWQADLEYSKDPEARLAALEKILEHSWEIGPEAVVPTLVAALQDEDSEIRTLALDGVHVIGDSEAQDTINDAVINMAESDPLPENRVQALAWLTERNPEDAMILLESSLSDSDPDIRDFAWALMQEFEVFAPNDGN